jgi:putative ABC transport system permease protein
MNPWPIVHADLRQTRAGAVAVVLLVALAVGLGVAVSAQERGLREGSARAADPFDLLIGAPGSEAQLVLSTVYLQPASLELIDGRLLQELGQNPSVRFASPIGFGDSWRGHPVVGVTADFVRRLASAGLAEGDVFTRLDQAVVGADVPLEIGSELVPTHGQVVLDEEDAERHEEFDYTVVGRLPRLGGPWDAAVVVPIEAVWWVHSLPVGHALDEARVFPEATHDEDTSDRADDAHGRGASSPDFSAIPIGPPWDVGELPGVPAIVVSPTSISAAYQLRQTYRAADATMAVFPAEVLVQLYGLLGDVRDLVAVISVLTQVLVIGAVLLAVLASLAQRRRLIGVLRALGASRAFVFTTVWLNVATMLTAGALAGLFVGWLGAFAVSAMFEARTDVALPVGLSWQEFRLVLTVIAFGLLLATLPAMLSYRGSVSAALKA